MGTGLRAGGRLDDVGEDAAGDGDQTKRGLNSDQSLAQGAAASFRGGILAEGVLGDETKTEKEANTNTACKYRYDDCELEGGRRKGANVWQNESNKPVEAPGEQAEA